MRVGGECEVLNGTGNMVRCLGDSTIKLTRLASTRIYLFSAVDARMPVARDRATTDHFK